MNISQEDKTVINQLINKYNTKLIENYINGMKKIVPNKYFNEQSFNNKMLNLSSKHDIKYIIEDHITHQDDKQ